MADEVYTPPRKKHKMNDFDFCYGGGLNWVDLSTNTVYYISEYKEAKENGQTPQGIRYQDVDGQEGYILEYKLRDKMNDPPVDPKYAPETPEEHRRNW